MNFQKWGFTGTIVALCILVGTPFSAYSQATMKPSLNSSHTAVKARFFDSVGIRPGAHISAGKLIIEVQKIDFDPRWDFEKWREIDPEYEERIRTSYAALLKEKLSAGFSEAGFDVVEDPDEATISVKAFMTRLQINTPELKGVTTSDTTVAGEADLRLELIDRTNQQLLARLTSFRRTQTRDLTQAQQTEAGSNYRDFGNMMGLWARESAIYLSDGTEEKEVVTPMTLEKDAEDNQ